MSGKIHNCECGARLPCKWHGKFGINQPFCLNMLTPPAWIFMRDPSSTELLHRAWNEHVHKKPLPPGWTFAIEPVYGHQVAIFKDANYATFFDIRKRAETEAVMAAQESIGNNTTREEKEDHLRAVAKSALLRVPEMTAALNEMQDYDIFQPDKVVHFINDMLTWMGGLTHVLKSLTASEDGWILESIQMRSAVEFYQVMKEFLPNVVTYNVRGPRGEILPASSKYLAYQLKMILKNEFLQAINEMEEWPANFGGNH